MLLFEQHYARLQSLNSTLNWDIFLTELNFQELQQMTRLDYNIFFQGFVKSQFYSF